MAITQKQARIRAQQKIYELMNRIELGPKFDSLPDAQKNKPIGYNAKYYETLFAGLTDSGFDTFMENLCNIEMYNLYYQISPMGTDGKKPAYEWIIKCLEHYHIPLTEYVVYPFKNPDDLDNPPVSATPIPVLYCLVRPMQQMLDKKIAATSDDDKRNLLSGQVSGSSKTTTFSNMQTAGMTIINEVDAARELLGPRADDFVSKTKMVDEIERTGKFDINNVPIRTENKTSLVTAKHMLIAAGLRVGIGTERATYYLPKEL